MPPLSLSELLSLVEADILDFEARMRAVVPSFKVGDRVDFYGELFEVSGFEATGMPGYWLKKDRGEPLFLPIDQESVLRSVVH